MGRLRPDQEAEAGRGSSINGAEAKTGRTRGIYVLEDTLRQLSVRWISLELAVHIHFVWLRLPGSGDSNSLRGGRAVICVKYASPSFSMELLDKIDRTKVRV